LAQARGEDSDSVYRHLSVFTEVLSLIQRGYVDETSVSDLFQGAFDGFGDGLDPLATYVPGPEVERYRRATVIGAAHSGIRVARGGGISYVVAVEDNSPAAAAGLERGDIIAEIDGESTRSMFLWQLEVRLADSSGTAELKLLRRGETITVELPLGPFERAEPTLRRHAEVPVVRLSRLDGEVRGKLEGMFATELDREERLVVDLRGVASEGFDSAYDVAGLLATGRLGELERRGDPLEVFEDSDEPVWSGQLAVLVDSGTQGAAEVLARILEQATGAILVGERTFGHAGRRVGHELGAEAVVFLSDAFYTGPDGEPIREGLEPAESVDRRRGARADGDPAIDRALQRAVEVLHSAQRRQAA
jgi:carboxyl-terminal processing protease